MQCLKINDCKWPLTDFFTPKEKGFSISGHIIKDHQDFLHIPTDIKIEDEVENRLNLLMSCHESIGVKIHPTSWYELMAIESISRISDIYYTLRRRNIVEQCISILTCEHTNIWGPGPKQDSQISKYLGNPFIINTHNFMAKLNLIKTQNYYLNRQEAVHLYTEDMMNITNARDFCSYLQLPYIEFKLSEFFGIEYGRNKSSMIKNYDQIMEIANSFFKNNNIARF